MAGWKYTMDGTGYPSMQKIADAVGHSFEWVQARIAILKRREFTSKELKAIHIDVGGVKRLPTVVFEGFGPATFGQMAADPKMCADLGRKQNFFRYRWKCAGMPKVVTRALFLEPKPRDPENPDVPVKNRSFSQESKYSDPKYLPDVPWGDLAHLSGDRNTGAARADLVPFYHGQGLGNVCQARIALP